MLRTIVPIRIIRIRMMAIDIAGTTQDVSVSYVFLLRTGLAMPATTAPRYTILTRRIRITTGLAMPATTARLLPIKLKQMVTATERAMPATTARLCSILTREIRTQTESEMFV